MAALVNRLGGWGYLGDVFQKENATVLLTYIFSPMFGKSNAARAETNLYSASMVDCCFAHGTWRLILLCKETEDKG